MTNAELITAVREHSMRNYNCNGWDVVVECWDDSDIVSAITPHPEITTTEAAIKHIGFMMKILNDYSTDIRNEAF